jgi:hypothetical protein
MDALKLGLLLACGESMDSAVKLACLGSPKDAIATLKRIGFLE